MRIRPATREDAALLVELIAALADYERLAHEARATPELLERNLFGASPGVEAAIAEGDDGTAIGFALWFPTFSTFEGRPGIWLEDLFVLPSQRGRGAGRALLAHVARLAVERDCARLEWSVLDWNEPALALYRSLGAQPMDEWTTQRLSGAPLARLAASTPPLPGA